MNLINFTEFSKHLSYLWKRKQIVGNYLRCVQDMIMRDRQHKCHHMGINSVTIFNDFVSMTLAIHVPSITMCNLDEEKICKRYIWLVFTI